MKFKGISIPSPSLGISIKQPDQVVPDQSLTLREILQRFTRGEPLALGAQTHYGSDSGIDPESDSEFNVDVEKARYWDLTEKDDFRAKVNQEKDRLEGLEKTRLEKVKAEKAEKHKAEFKAAVEKEAAKLAGKTPASGGSI